MKKKQRPTAAPKAAGAPAIGPAHDAYRQGLDARRAGNRALAGIFYRACLSLDPGHAEAHHDLGILLAEAGEAEEAVGLVQAAVALRPDFATAHSSLCLILSRLKRFGEAAVAGRRAVGLDPRSAAVHAILGEALIGQGDLDGAIAALQGAIRIDSRFFGAYVTLANAFLVAQRYEDALQACRAGIELAPQSAKARNVLGTIYGRAGMIEQAIECFRRAVALDPTLVSARINLGHDLVKSGALPEALACCAEALALDPQADVLIDVWTLRRLMCDWTGLDRDLARALGRAPGPGRKASGPSGRRFPPLGIITSDVPVAEHLAYARTWADALPRSQPLAVYAPRPVAQRAQRLRVGYLSADFCNHATALLVVDLFERHDRYRFETFGYSIGRTDDSAIGRRIVASLEHFTDLRPMSYADAARRIAADGIDILVDLKGYTEGSRTEIMACRPAPIQVNYLGYPGSMGASFIDYLIADAMVVPEGHEPLYDETIVRLPHSYQPNDSARAASTSVPSRAECGLPEQGFVFCCFNNTYKITPSLFDVWMRLLAGAPGSVLWLLEANPVVADNLRREARHRGVDAGRLLFASRVETDLHIARMAAGDLFLDTMPTNAHTTASEALWAGLPVLTCLGGSFVSRVAGSLLHAVGLPELVTTSLADYEALASALARDPAEMQRLRRTLDANRRTAPLFDAARYTRNFEAALLQMSALRDAGRPPESFSQPDLQEQPIHA